MAHQIPSDRLLEVRIAGYLRIEALFTASAGDDMRTVIYEWNDESADGPTYTPVIGLEPGTTGGPITDCRSATTGSLDMRLAPLDLSVRICRRSLAGTPSASAIR